MNEDTTTYLTNAEAHKIAKKARTDKIFEEIRKTAQFGGTRTFFSHISDEERALLHTLGYAVENLGKYQTSGWYVKWEK